MDVTACSFKSRILAELELFRRCKEERPKREAGALAATISAEKEAPVAELKDDEKAKAEKEQGLIVSRKPELPWRFACEPISEPWYLDQALLLQAGEARSQVFWLYGYAGRMVAELSSSDEVIQFSLYLEICPGPIDEHLIWPFCMPYTVSAVSPHSPDHSIRRHVDLRSHDMAALLPHFGKPDGKPNKPYGFTMASLDYMKQLFGSEPFHLALTLEFWSCLRQEEQGTTE